MDLYDLECPACKQDMLRAFRVFPLKGKPDVVQKYCVDCNYPMSKGGRLEPLNLPPIKRKKIIYLDQNVISEMTKSLHPDHAPELPEPVKERGIEIFSRLDRLRKAQCIVCPYSWDHRRESVVEQVLFRDLMRMYTYMANDTRFIETFEIQKKQIECFTLAWIRGEIDTVDFSDDSVFEKNPHHWYSKRINEAFSYVVMEDEDQDVRSVTDQHHPNFVNKYNEWKQKPDQQVFDEEAKAFTVWFLKCIGQKLTNQSAGMDPGEITHCLDIVNTVANVFQKENVSCDLQKIMKIFSSDEFVATIPFVRYAASMNYCLAQKAKRKEANIEVHEWVGEQTDINRISNYAVYCDAVVTDKFFAERFNEQEIIDLVGDRCKFFHLKKYDEFMQYLDEIENEYSTQIEEATKIFGDISPSTDMYEMQT